MQPKKSVLVQVLLVALFTGIILSHLTFGNSQVVTINAVVGVTCPFSVTVSPQSIYVQEAGASIPYSIKTLTPCTTSTTGNLMVSNDLTSTLYYTITADFSNFGQTPTNGVFTISPNVLEFGTSDLLFFEASLNDTNSSVAQFQAVSAANLTIVSASVTPSNPQVNSQISVTENVLNNGALEANNVELNVRIEGPNGFFYLTNTILSDLSPSQSESSTFSISGVTPTQGTYQVLQNVSFQTSFTSGSNTITLNGISSNYSTTYTITSSSSGGGGGSGLGYLNTTLPEPKVTVGSLVFTQMPILSTLIAGNSTLMSLGLHDNATVPIWVNITVPKFKFGLISLSASSIYLLPGQTVNIQIYIYANANSSTESYVLPVNYTITPAVVTRSSSGTAIKAQFYTAFKIVQLTTRPVFLKDTVLSPGGNLLIQYSVYNPTNMTLLNTLLTTEIPEALAINSTILLTGDINNLTRSAGEYLLNWRIPSLQAHGTTFLTYSATNISKPSYFYTPVSSLSVVSSNYTALKIFDIHVPTFYTERAGNISVSALYTGTNQSTITFILSPPLGITVQAQDRRFQAAPNTALNMTFDVNPISNSGTYIFELYVNGQHINQSYSIPVVVLSQSQFTPTTTTSQTSTVHIVNLTPTESTYVTAAAVLFLAMAAIYAWYRKRPRARYDKVRMESLMRMKQRVKRELDNEKDSEVNRELDRDRD